MKNNNVRLPLLVTLVVSLFFLNSISADTEIDQLHQLIEEANSEEAKVNSYINLLWELDNQAHSQLDFYAEEFLNYAQNYDLKKGMAHAYKYKGFANKYKNKYEDAIEFYRIARELFIEIDDYENAIVAQENIYFDFVIIGEIKETERAFEKYEDLVQQADIAPSWGRYYQIQANRMADKGNQKEMILYSKKAIKLYESLGEKYLQRKAATLANLANSLGSDNLQGAINYLNEAATIANDVENYPLLAYVSDALSAKYVLLGNHEDAVRLLYKGITAFDSLGLTIHLINAKVSLAHLYQKLNNEDNTLKEFEEALAKSEEVSYSFGKLISLIGLSSFYDSKENYEKAIYFGERGIAIADSIKRIGYKLEFQPKIASSYIKSGQADKGYALLLSTLEDNKGSTNDDVDGYCYNGLAHYFSIKEDWLSTGNFSQKAYDIFNKEGNIEGRRIAAHFLYEANKNQKNYNKALQWLEIDKELGEKVLNEKNIRSLTSANLNANFKEEKKILAAEQANKEVLLKAKAERNLLASFGIGLLALLGFGFFYNSRRKNKIIAAANHQLEQVNQTKDRIFAIIGHDLRKPVVAFNGISETINYLVKKEDYSTLQQLGAEIEKDGFALQKLTDNLLNWALTQRDVMPYHPQEINLSQKAEEIILIFEKVARDKNIDLVNKVPKGMNIFADPNALLTILMNLVDNALKFTPTGGLVELEAIHSTEGIKILVSDNGVGMTKEQVRDIFLLHKDKSQKGTSGEKGTGLGLHLVNELVKMNRGKIEAESNSGGGTKFEVLLPANRLEAA